jgi:TPP-dependent pyruvate/acetoin dehydrogenase alpha subunit
VPVFRTRLRDAGILTDAIEEQLTAEIKGIVDEATEYAESQPDPDPATAMRYVFVEDVD